MAGTIRVELLRAWPRRHELHVLDLPRGATVADAIAAARLAGPDHTGLAVFGERVDADRVLADGDRVELLRPLVADPKEARRRRAGTRAR